jgi:hypothetical protein
MAKKPLTAQSTVSDKEKALQAMQQNATVRATQNTETDKETHRYNIEIPNDMFVEIKDFIKASGYNLKGFFLAAAKDKIEREKTS